MKNLRNGFVQASESMAAWMNDREANMDREDFVGNLGVLLSQTREGIEGCYLDRPTPDQEFVHVVYRGGSEQLINVHLDSYMAIIRDVVKNIKL